MRQSRPGRSIDGTEKPWAYCRRCSRFRSSLPSKGAFARETADNSCAAPPAGSHRRSRGVRSATTAPVPRRSGVQKIHAERSATPSRSECGTRSAWPSDYARRGQRNRRLCRHAHSRALRRRKTESLLLARARRAPRCGATSGAGSALRSSLPLDVIGSCGMLMIADGTMNAGRLPRELRSQRLGILAWFAAGTTYATRRLSPGPILPDDYCRLRHCRIAQQRRLDFTRLNSESADLHLIVHAADIFQHAVAAPARQIAGSIHAAARHGPNGSATKRSAVSAGWLR